MTHLGHRGELFDIYQLPSGREALSFKHSTNDKACSEGPYMRRREFITLVGGAAVWPLAARAQQPERMRRIGVLMGYAENDPEAQARALLALGWDEGRNLRIDLRWASGDIDRASNFAKELVALHPGVILSNTTPVTAALQRE